MDAWWIVIIVGAPLAAFGIIWAIAYPLMFLYAALTSERKLVKSQAALVDREMKSLEHFRGSDPLSSLKGDHIIAGVEASGLVYASIVYGPSAWHQLIGWFTNLFGGRIDVYHRVIALARSETLQRLREKMQSDGWDDILNVRIDTSEMSPGGGKSHINAVEVFAYGTGVRFG